MPTRPRTDAVRRAQAKYDKAHTRQFLLKLNDRTDGDIIAFLDSLENKQGYIKQIIRADMAARGLGADGDAPANETPASE